jgi:hypothetical protein
MADLYSVRDSQVQKANDLIQGVKVKRHRRDLYPTLRIPITRWISVFAYDTESHVWNRSRGWGVEPLVADLFLTEVWVVVVIELLQMIIDLDRPVCWRWSPVLTSWQCLRQVVRFNSKIRTCKSTDKSRSHRPIYNYLDQLTEYASNNKLPLCLTVQVVVACGTALRGA